jgi:predicted NBD/HSP70 family sugar kinase
VNIKAFKRFSRFSVLSDTYGIPAVLEEVSRAMALAEIMVRGAERFDDVICIDAGFGIGIGIVHEGRSCTGEVQKLSGEIGHTLSIPKGGSLYLREARLPLKHCER